MNFIKTHAVKIVYIILFVLPFFWYKPGYINLGGDSSRLYFIEPLNYLKNTLYYVNYQVPLEPYLPAFFLIPFVMVLMAMKWILFNNSYVLNCVYSGIILSNGFYFTYLCIKELIRPTKGRHAPEGKFGAILGGLLFTFTPLLIYEWYLALYYISHFFSYPLAFYFYLKYLHTKKNKYLVYIALSTFIFSNDYNFSVVPWFVGFFGFSFIFLFIKEHLDKNLKAFFVGTLKLVVLVGLIQAFQLIPQTYNLIDPTNINSKLIFDRKVSLDRGVAFYGSVVDYMRVEYSMLMQQPYILDKAYSSSFTEIIYKYGQSILVIFSIYLVIPLFAMSKIKYLDKDKRHILKALFLVYILCVFFITANLSPLAKGIYTKFYSIPGFSMFRGFYHKFALPLGFFGSLLFGYSFYILENLLPAKVRKFLFYFCFIAILYNGYPLISGKIMAGYFYLSDKVSYTLKFPDEYLGLLSDIRALHLDTKFITFPLGYEAYQAVSGGDNNAYVGPTIINMLTQKGDISGLLPTFELQDTFANIIKNKNIPALKNFLRYTNIGYAFYDSDEFLYARLRKNPYTTIMTDVYKTQDDVKNLVEGLGWEKIIAVSTYNVYENDKNYIPKIYVPQSIVLFADNKPESIAKSLESLPDSNDVIYYSDQNVDKSFVGTTNPEIAFYKVDPTKYYINIKNASGKFTLVFNEKFQRAWELKADNLKSSSKYRFISDLFAPNLKVTNTQANLIMNSWQIDPLKLCAQADFCRKSAGGLDINIILYFPAQNYFYAGSLISVLTLLGCVVYLVKDSFAKK